MIWTGYHQAGYWRKYQIYKWLDNMLVVLLELEITIK